MRTFRRCVYDLRKKSKTIRRKKIQSRRRMCLTRDLFATEYKNQPRSFSTNKFANQTICSSIVDVNFPSLYQFNTKRQIELEGRGLNRIRFNYNSYGDNSELSKSYLLATCSWRAYLWPEQRFIAPASSSRPSRAAIEFNAQ